jgi:autotransporter-associated beta strand protein
MVSLFIQRRRALIAAAVAASLGLWSASFAHAQNLLQDGDFEAGEAGSPSAANGDTAMSTGGPWAGWNNWVAPYSGFYTSAISMDGTQAGKTFSGPNGGVYQSVAVTPGERYTAAAYFYNLPSDALTADQTIDVRVTYYSGPNGTGNNLGLVISPTVLNMNNLGAQWTQIGETSTAPATAQSATWLAFFQDPDYGGGAMYVDDASMVDSTWNGGGTSNNWSDANNWNGVPLVQYTPLVFGGSTNTTTNNDTPAGNAYYGITFTANASSFTLSGNEANLASDVVNNSAATQNINIALGLQQDTTFNTAAGNMNVSGAIGGAFAVIKTGNFKLTLSGSNTYTGATTVNAGTLVVANQAALPAGNDLIINAGTLVVSNLGAPYAVSVGNLNDAGLIDLTDNSMVIHDGGIGSVLPLVQTGYNNGAWNASTGIVSSTAVSNTRHNTAVGIITNDNGSGTPLYSTFDGAATVDGDVLVKYTYYGDTNLDGKVDGSDYARIDSGYLTQATGWFNGDFNYDGVINGSDYTLIDNAYNTQGAQLAASIANPTAQVAASAVPEPATLGLIGIGSMSLIGRRRKRCL